MYDDEKKIKTTVIGQVLGISGYLNYKNIFIETLSLLCYSEKLKKPVQAYFNFSSRWKDQGLSTGDYVSFTATLKIASVRVHKEDRWVDSWDTLPPEMADYEDFIEVKSPSQIKKLSSFDKIFLCKD